MEKAHGGEKSSDGAPVADPLGEHPYHHLREGASQQTGPMRLPRKG